jgi:hypothetical protein
MTSASAVHLAVTMVSLLVVTHVLNAPMLRLEKLLLQQRQRQLRLSVYVQRRPTLQQHRPIRRENNHAATST